MCSNVTCLPFPQSPWSLPLQWRQRPGRQPMATVSMPDTGPAWRTLCSLSQSTANVLPDPSRCRQLCMYMSTFLFDFCQLNSWNILEAVTCTLVPAHTCMECLWGCMLNNTPWLPYRIWRMWEARWQALMRYVQWRLRWIWSWGPLRSATASSSAVGWLSRGRKWRGWTPWDTLLRTSRLSRWVPQIVYVLEMCTCVCVSVVSHDCIRVWNLVVFFSHHSTLRFLLPPLQSTVQSHLVSLQPQFKTNLLESVEVYKHDLTSFLENYSQVRHAGSLHPAGCMLVDTTFLTCIFKTQVILIWPTQIT